MIKWKQAPKIQVGDLGSAVKKAPPAGTEAEPQLTNDLVHFSLKM